MRGVPFRAGWKEGYRVVGYGVNRCEFWQGWKGDWVLRAWHGPADGSSAISPPNPGLACIEGRGEIE